MRSDERMSCGPANGRGRNSSRWNDEMRALNELLKIPVIKLELVIKIENRENVKTGTYAQGVK